MAHFYGTLQGHRGQASRLGTTKSGLTVRAASWQGAVRVDLDYDFRSDTDIVEVFLTPWHGAGIRKLLYRGPVGGPTAQAVAEPESEGLKRLSGRTTRDTSHGAPGCSAVLPRDTLVWVRPANNLPGDAKIKYWVVSFDVCKDQGMSASSFRALDALVRGGSGAGLYADDIRLDRPESET